jgi:heme oxygenase (mycobilin-producing)
MSVTIRVIVTATIPLTAKADFETAYLRVTGLMRGTPGLLGDELLSDTDQPGHYLLLSEWEDEESFRAWESSGIHRQITVPMRPYWSGSYERRIFRLAGRLAVDDIPQPA